MKPTAPLSTASRIAALTLTASLALILAACGGSGSGGGASPVSADSNAAVAAQIDEIRPADETESVGVFVELDGNAPVAAAAVSDSETRRAWLQQRFLADFGAAAAGPVAGAVTSVFAPEPVADGTRKGLRAASAAYFEKPASASAVGAPGNEAGS